MHIRETRDQGPPIWLVLFVLLSLASVPFAIYFHITQPINVRACVCPE